MDTITSAKNPLIRDMKSLNTRKGRQEKGLFLIEGEKLIEEATACGLVLRAVIAERRFADYAEKLANGDVRVGLVPRDLLESVCDTKTPQGICAAFEMPEATAGDKLPDRIVALDGVQDPGNVGTIWRTADAAGFQGILMGEGCADPMSPRVQRSAMGSGFRLPFAIGSLAGILPVLKEKGYSVVASDLKGTDFYSHPAVASRFVLVIGNEARGVSDDVMALADMRLKLPMRGGAESLNAAVAAGIMMYELMKD